MGSQPSEKNVFLGEEYVNNKTMSDVTFMVEGKPFYAHRIALLASSDAFRAMFMGNYREREAAEIPIPNIRFEVFHSMMQCIYTGMWCLLEARNVLMHQQQRSCPPSTHQQGRHK